MIDRIYNLKGQLLGRIDKEVAQGIDRIDVNETEKLVDMIKDLSEAEYYCAVTDAMKGSSGYSSNGRMNYSDRSGWQNQYGSGYSYMGHTDMVDSLRSAMSGMSPDERNRMREQLRPIMEM